jgi:hypothetical protein
VDTCYIFHNLVCLDPEKSGNPDSANNGAIFFAVLDPKYAKRQNHNIIWSSIQGCQMGYFCTNNPNLYVYFRGPWTLVYIFGICSCKHLEYFTAIRYLLWSFGLFYTRYFFSILVHFTKKYLATLPRFILPFFKFSSPTILRVGGIHNV